MALKQQLGKLERVPVTDIWKNEAADFTPWLQANADVLEEAIGFRLPDLEKETSTGNFNVDLIGDSGETGIVVIENQFGKSDHDHLGKLLTYMAAMEAKIAIWIVEVPRQEHVKAISWLNDNSPNSFYLLQFEAVRIGDSVPAPVITLIAGPSESNVAGTKEVLKERHLDRLEFWSQLLEKLKQKHIKRHSNLSPKKEYWLSAGAGKSGLSYDYIVNQKSSSLVLYIDCGNGEKNLMMFHALQAAQATIESQLGAALDWQELEGKRACRIAWPIAETGLQDKSRWPELQDKLIEAMQAFIKALQPHIDALKE